MSTQDVSQSDNRSASPRQGGRSPAPAGPRPQTGGRTPISEDLQLFLDLWEKITPEEQLMFFRQKSLAVLHTVSSTGPGRRLRIRYIENHEPLFPVISSISRCLNAISYFRLKVVEGYASLTPEALELLAELSVKGFQENGRPQEIKPFAPIVEACDNLNSRISSIIDGMNATIPERRRRGQPPRRSEGQQTAEEQFKPDEATPSVGDGASAAPEEQPGSGGEMSESTAVPAENGDGQNYTLTILGDEIGGEGRQALDPAEQAPEQEPAPSPETPAEPIEEAKPATKRPRRGSKDNSEPAAETVVIPTEDGPEVPGE